MKDLTLADLSNINAGGNVANCGLSISAASGVLAGVALASGPIGWVAAGAAAVGSAAFGFSAGYSCAALAHNGD